MVPLINARSPVSKKQIMKIEMIYNMYRYRVVRMLSKGLLANAI
jgi:hypothetical protein